MCGDHPSRIVLTSIAKTYGFDQPQRETLQDAIQIMRWADQHHKRARYSYKRCKAYATRSAIEVLQDAHVNFYAPCLDICAVVGHLLNENGFKSDCILYEAHSFFEHRAIHARVRFEVQGAQFRFSPYRIGAAYYPEKSNIDAKRTPLAIVEYDQIDVQEPVLEHVVQGGISNMRALIPFFSHRWLTTYIALKNSQKKFDSVRCKTGELFNDPTSVRKPVGSQISFIDDKIA